MLFDLNDFDPILVETVERSLEPYKKALSPQLIDVLREEALVLLTHHPYPAALVQQIRVGDRPMLQHSTTQPKNDAAKGPASVKSGGEK